ncbi:phosphoesterase [Methanothermobacter thermautotrophicus]|jgi:putative SbcD/Mre11-related phosphoesterase|uniref:Phosphoesterase n=1 Tax=Methanothermobacter thermautotrophicus TaxID=145262 RepID=A0A842YSR8_METTF|nr:metallophosphoesterase [Methanothermobacter thermautotrophicus]MBE2900685.1 phosphoesterase [Methanothermobacter thermautotrophicus]MCQ8905100.1 metallophosphoesterase [Methanothermobacter sp.]
MKTYRLMDDLEICDLSLLIEDSMVIADLHLGYEQYLNRQGVMVPGFQFRRIIERIDTIRDVSGASSIIINGDLKHEFGRVSWQENREIIRMMDYLEENFRDITIIRGNHDPLIPHMSRVSHLSVTDTLRISGFLLAHGHVIPEDLDAGTIIIGHEHPCVGLRSGERVEKIKCFLLGPFRDRKLLVMPSFNFVTEGSDILHEDILSPLLREAELTEFLVYGVEDFEVFEFGTVGDLLKFQQKTGYPGD